MNSVKALLLVGVLAVTVSGQLNLSQLGSNRCLVLLKPAFDENLFSSTISNCVKTLASVLRSNSGQFSDRVKKELVGRCIARGLGLINSSSVINKDRLSGLINNAPGLSDSQRQNFLRAVQNCNDFSTCLSNECNVL